MEGRPVPSGETRSPSHGTDVAQARCTSAARAPQRTMRHSTTFLLSPVLLSVALGGCAGTWEETTRSDLDHAALGLEPEADDGAVPAFDGSLEGYVAYAMRDSPELRASFERWRAATLQISRARRLPEPTLSYAYYVRSVETRVGPQRHRVMLSQTFPWPTRLSAGADAASYAARAAERRFDALALAVRRRVADVYWRLWLVHHLHALKTEHDQVLEALEGTVRARVEVGAATLADLAQLNLDILRHHDHHGEHAEAMRGLSAELAATIGAPPGTPTPINGDSPAGGLPAEDEEALRQAAREHPRIEVSDLMAQASETRAEVEDADRYPSFMLDVTWIETGEAMMPTTQGSGTDPLIVGISMRLPLWWGSYSDAEGAARAEGAAFAADADAGRLAAESELEQAIAGVRDAERRIHLYADTLVPQAGVAYESVVGSYQSGRSGVAALLLAQRDLLELQLSLVRARADHARAWAALEMVVGHAVTARGPEDHDG